MKFGEAIACAIAGNRIRRAGWSNRKAFVIFVPGQTAVELRAGTPYHTALAAIAGEPGDQLAPTVCDIGGHLDMIAPPEGERTTTTAQPGWLASQADMLADDWQMI